MIIKHTPYFIRNYRASDWDGFLQICRDAANICNAGLPFSTQSLKEQLQRPNYSPAKNLFIVERDHKITGFMDVNPEIDIGRVVLTCFIYPQHRKKGLAASLLNCASKRALELGASLIHTNIQQDNEVGKAVLARLGFTCIRTFAEMKKNITDCPIDDKAKTAEEKSVYYSSLRPGQEELLTNLQNKAFTGSFGFNPNTVKEISYRLNILGSSPEDVILAWMQGEAVGYCWTRRDEDTKTGEIHMLGVAPNFRGQNIGKELVKKAILHLREKGMGLVKLTVDKNNPPAYHLYSSLGFEEEARTLWFEKEIN